MKKITTFLLALVLSFALIMQTGCYGSFSLTKKVYEFNGNVGDKFINTVVFWVLNIVPVYSIAVFLDAVLFNLIEFWTGSNPLAMNEGDIDQQIIKAGDLEYLITTTRNNIHIEQLVGPQQGESADIIFRPENNSCYFSYQGSTIKVAEYNPADLSTLKVFLPDGSSLTVNSELRDMNIIRGMLQQKTVLLASE
jgi:hypothetical protein